MKKLLKAALVLMALALMSVACTKAKTMGIVGAYYGGSLKMTVGSDGRAYIEKKDPTITQENLTSEEYVMYRYFYFNGGNLMPWDLTAEKTTLSYTSKIQVNVNQGSASTQEPKYVDVEVKFDFTKEKENYKCVVSTSLPEEVKTLLNTQLTALKKAEVGNDIKIELTKPITK
ncbi:hypothetical protein [uncultured Brachyspira sp.]|uniref:hypothetical protein n=1 Tax=uncultured Brachyspira sp. TaxID=221953 RepID=UPI0025E3679C|nr:hypothetical protein [uncultured Brachyspira sp.]